MKHPVSFTIRANPDNLIVYPSAGLILYCRYQVRAAYVVGDAEAALAAVASHRLYRYDDAGDLLPEPSCRALLQVAVNLRLHEQVGRAVIHAAINAAPRLCDLAEAA
jgi:hypothetical protein